METVSSVFSAEFYSVSTCKSSWLVVFLENYGIPYFLGKSNLFKGLFCQRCEKGPFRCFSCHFPVTSWQLLARLGWFNEGYGIVLFRLEKYGKRSLFQAGSAKNSTTGCGVLSKAQKVTRKVTKKDQKVTLFHQNGQPLTISMGKSLPFDERPERPFWDSWWKQSI